MAAVKQRAEASPEPERAEVVDALTALGMTPIDADVYLRLSTAGPQKAGSLAKSMGWSRAETYRVLQRLVESEFVEAALTRPVEFRAVPVAALFARLQRIQQERLARIDASRSAVEERLARLQQRTGDPDTEAGLAVFHDRVRVLSAADRMITEARQSLRLIVGSTFVARALAASGVTESIERRAREGVEVQIVLPEDERSPAVMPISHLARRVPRGERDVSLLIADGHETLCWLDVAPTGRLQSEDEKALWTDATNFVALQELLFQTLWVRASQ